MKYWQQWMKLLNAMAQTSTYWIGTTNYHYSGHVDMDSQVLCNCSWVRMRLFWTIEWVFSHNLLQKWSLSAYHQNVPIKKLFSCGEADNSSRSKLCSFFLSSFFFLLSKLKKLSCLWADLVDTLVHGQGRSWLPCHQVAPKSLLGTSKRQRLGTKFE